MTDITLIKQRFKSSIKRGTGEAHLLMQSYPAIDFSAAIIKASLTPYGYDPQAEGSRALYLSELITLSKRQDKIRAAILAGLANEQEDTWALVQLFDLATFFAKQGDKTARQAIYDRFYKIIEGSDWCGYDSILELDGIAGLQFIATTIGRAIEKDPDNWQDSSIIDKCQGEYPAINVRKELEKAATENRYIKIYLDNITQTESNRKKSQIQHPRPVINYATVSERINSKAISPIFRPKELPKADLKKLANDFLKETDRLKLEKYMRVFSMLKYPYDYKPILQLAYDSYLNTRKLA